MKLPRKDIIDLVNFYFKEAHRPKKCPRCGGTLLQHRHEPRAWFCSDCFRLYEMRDATFDRWHRLVSGKRKKPIKLGPKK